MADEGEERQPERDMAAVDVRLRVALERRVRQKAATGRPDRHGSGMRIAADLVAGVVVGAMVGVLLDRWLGTGPWLFLVFFVLGSGAGIRSVFRAAERMKVAERMETASHDEKDGD